MKYLIILSVFTLSLILIAESKPYLQTGVSFGVFYSSLQNYGEWINCNWGYAWRPMHLVHGWRPYLDGRWVWTDFGWYWVSGEPFGWATYHYGRWYYDDYYGWIWIPGYDWGPAWVEWRYDDDFIGWAPLSPYARFSIGIGITFADNWAAPMHYWNFTPCRYFTSPHIRDYVQEIERTRRIFGNTRGGELIREENNRIMNRGVEKDFVERRINTRINRVDIIDRDRGRSERLIRDRGRDMIEVYRPRFEERTGNEREINRNQIKEPIRKIETRREQQRENIPIQKRVELSKPPQHEIQKGDIPRERRQEQQRELLPRQREEQRVRERQTLENKSRETPRFERQQPQIRERQTLRPRENPRPPERRTESRGVKERPRP